MSDRKEGPTFVSPSVHSRSQSYHRCIHYQVDRHWWTWTSLSYEGEGDNSLLLDIHVFKFNLHRCVDNRCLRSSSWISHTMFTDDNLPVIYCEIERRSFIHMTRAKPLQRSICIAPNKYCTGDIIFSRFQTRYLSTMSKTTILKQRTKNFAK